MVKKILFALAALCLMLAGMCFMIWMVDYSNGMDGAWYSYVCPLGSFGFLGLGYLLDPERYGY